MNLGIPQPPLGILKGVYPPPLDALYEWWLYIVIITAILYIFKKIKKMNYQRTVIIWKEGYHEIKDVKNKDGKLDIKGKKKIALSKDANKKQWTPVCGAEHLIPPKIGVWDKIKPFGFKQKPLAIAVEDADECVIVTGTKLEGVVKATISQKIASVLMKKWTKSEIRSFISKAMAIGTVSRKVFDDKQFYMFMGVLLFILYMVFRIAQRVGAL